MLSLTGKKIVVIGGSRGVGLRIVEAAIGNGGQVLAVARQQAPLRQPAQEIPGTEVLSLDATDEGAPAKVFDVLEPDILVLCAGAFPPAAPLYQQSWQEFAVNWETDVKIAFHFCKAALSRPLPRGSSIVLIASGAAGHQIVGVSHDDHVAPGLVPSPALGPEIETVMQVDIGEERRDHRALTRSPVIHCYDPVFEYTRPQPFLDQVDDALIADPMFKVAH